MDGHVILLRFFLGFLTVFRGEAVRAGSTLTEGVASASSTLGEETGEGGGKAMGGGDGEGELKESL